MRKLNLTRIALTCIVLAALGENRSGGQNLADIPRITGGVSTSHVEYHSIQLAPDAEYVLADLRGPGRITYFYFTDDTRGKLYPGLVLKVFWDNEREPSIAVPLADFFGAMGGRTIDYQSVPMQINHYCYMCYLPMPFRQRARLVLRNDGDRDYAQSVAYGVDMERNTALAREKSRLHAVWRRSNPTEDSLHTLLEVQGRGHYIGNFLQVHSRYAGWWGEGDTIFHIDGQAVTHTPGTEDEYGSCWCFEHTYNYLYSGYIQMEKEDHRMFRWYLANPVRFQRSLKVEIQNQRWRKAQIPSRDDYTSTAFWYQQEPHRPIVLQPYTDRVAPTKAGDYELPAAGASP